MIIVNSLTNFMLITSMLIAKLTLFLHNADWLTCHFKLFSLFVVQWDWLVLPKHSHL